MSIKLGLEVEFFVTKGGKLVDASLVGIPHDEYPLLAEARGEPFTCPFKAVHSVMAEIDRMVAMLPEGHKPLFVNWAKKDDHFKKLHEEILRRGLSKGIKWQNIHGHATSEKNETHLSAGMHVSFTNSTSFSYPDIVTKTIDGKAISWTETKNREYNQLFDFLKLFIGIEKEFGTEIKRSERTLGFYEIKTDGRVEYRSLPATLIHSKGFAARLAKRVK